MSDFSVDAHWRDSARSTRFFLIDARAAFPVFLFLVHIRWWTGMLVIISTLFFAIIERYGFTLPVFLRLIQGLAAGKHKISQPWWRGYEY